MKMHLFSRSGRVIAIVALLIRGLPRQCESRTAQRRKDLV